MIKPICPKCGNDHFISQMMVYPVFMSENKHVYLIYCSKCGCVVGAVSDK